MVPSAIGEFIYTGAAQHHVDEAYEEAAYLKTNRFLAAYVVDEANRASYINDLLNEGFHQVRCSDFNHATFTYMVGPALRKGPPLAYHGFWF